MARLLAALLVALAASAAAAQSTRHLRQVTDDPLSVTFRAPAPEFEALTLGQQAGVAAGAAAGVRAGVAAGLAAEEAALALEGAGAPAAELEGVPPERVAAAVGAALGAALGAQRGAEYGELLALIQAEASPRLRPGLVEFAGTGVFVPPFVIARIQGGAAGGAVGAAVGAAVGRAVVAALEAPAGETTNLDINVLEVAAPVAAVRRAPRLAPAPEAEAVLGVVAPAVTRRRAPRLAAPAPEAERVLTLGK